METLYDTAMLLNRIALNADNLTCDVQGIRDAIEEEDLKGITQEEVKLLEEITMELGTAVEHCRDVERSIIGRITPPVPKAVEWNEHFEKLWRQLAGDHSKISVHLYDDMCENEWITKDKSLAASKEHRSNYLTEKGVAARNKWLDINPSEK